MRDIAGSFIINNTTLVNIIDTSHTVPNDGTALAILANILDLGEKLSSSTMSGTDGSTHHVLKSRGVFDNPKPVEINAVHDDGLLYALDSFAGGQSSINGNSFISISTYARAQGTTTGGIYFSLLNKGLDVSGTGTITEYTNGTAVELQSGTTYRGFLVFCKGLLYAVSLKNEMDIGYFNPLSVVYNRGLRVPALKLYVLTPKVFTIQGRITDYYSESAEGIDIRVFHKDNNRLMGSTVSTSTGEYEVDIMGMSGDECFMVLMSPQLSEFQSKVVDTIILN